VSVQDLEFLTDFDGIFNGESAPKSVRQVSVWPASVGCNPCFTQTQVYKSSVSRRQLIIVRHISDI